MLQVPHTACCVFRPAFGHPPGERIRYIQARKLVRRCSNKPPDAADRDGAAWRGAGYIYIYRRMRQVEVERPGGGQEVINMLRPGPSSGRASSSPAPAAVRPRCRAALLPAPSLPPSLPPHSLFPPLPLSPSSGPHTRALASADSLLNEYFLIRCNII